jgi:alkanesulfonate monooxygenase SsuD/methylene tetrahydromethanopterin reductase-like flavin-dependent oxidoreductase (luciferase family)
MFKYAFIGNHDVVKQKTQSFLEQTGVDEIMVSSNFYHHKDRLRSYEIFKEVMKEINLVAQLN